MSQRSRQNILSVDDTIRRSVPNKADMFLDKLAAQPRDIKTPNTTR